MIEQGLIDFLLNDTRVTALIGERLSKGFAPQNDVRPYVTLMRISTVRWRSHSGPAGVQDSRVQLTAWGRSSLEAATVADACRKVLDPPGGFKRASMGPFFVQSCWADNDRDLEQPPVSGQGVTDSGVTFDVMLTWVEPLT